MLQEQWTALKILGSYITHNSTGKLLEAVYQTTCSFPVEPHEALYYFFTYAPVPVNTL